MNGNTEVTDNDFDHHGHPRPGQLPETAELVGEGTNTRLLDSDGDPMFTGKRHALMYIGNGWYSVSKGDEYQRNFVKITPSECRHATRWERFKICFGHSVFSYSETSKRSNGRVV